MPTDDRPYKLAKFRGKYAVVWYDEAGRHRYSTGTDDKGKAEHLAPSVYASVTTGNGDTVEAIWKAYTIDKAGRAVIGTMKHTWKAVGPRFGPMKPEAITIEDCREHTRVRREAGISDGTIHTELGHVRMVLLWWEKRGKIKAPYIERPPKPRSKTEHLTRGEVQRLIDHATRPHIKLYIILAIGTAARPGALLDLTWDRCDFIRGLIQLENPEITVPHKGRAEVAMTDTARRALGEAVQGRMCDHVIEWAGHRVKSVKRALAASAKRAGIEKHVHPHMMRHTAAVHMAEDGASMDEIAQYLGHSDVGMTRKVYARFSPTYLKKAASSLEYDYAGTLVPIRPKPKGR